jgi:hypothetical protein
MHTRIGLTALAMSFVALERTQSPVVRAHLYCARGPLSVETEWSEDPLIVSGTVDSLTEVVGPDSLHLRTIYHVQVTRAYRGAPAPTVAVFSENDSGRFPMQRGVGYLLFLSRWEDGHLHVESCGNSRPLARATDVIRRVRALARLAAHR